MEQSVTAQKSSGTNRGFTYAIVVTILHAAQFFSWIILRAVRSDLNHEELTSLFSQYWIIPEFIGLRWFLGILLVLSFSAVIILGRRVDQKKGFLSVLLLVFTILLILLSGWSLL